MKSIQLQIESPCSQHWQAMTPENGGRFCDHCRKTVVDFTDMSDSALLRHIREQGLGCGRFREDQLERIVAEPPKASKRWWQGVMLSLAVMTGMAKETRGQQQTAPPAYQLPANRPDSGKNEEAPPASDGPISLSIVGVLVDQKGEPVPNAAIGVRDQDQRIAGTITDYDGNFEIKAMPGQWVGRSVTLHFVYQGNSLVTQMTLREGINRMDAQLYVRPLKEVQAAIFLKGKPRIHRPSFWQRAQFSLKRFFR